MPWRRFVRHASLRNPCLLWNLSLHSLPEAWGPWERQHAPPALQHACIMHAKDRIVVSKLWITGCWLRACDCFKSTKNCRDWAFSNSGLEVGPAFELPMFTKCDALKELCSTCLSKESIPFVKSRPPLPARSLRSLRAAVRSTSSALCLYYACKRSHPFVEDSGFVSHAEKQSVWSRSCRLQDLLRTIQWLCPRFGLTDIDCALTCDMWLLQTGEQLLRLSF